MFLSGLTGECQEKAFGAKLGVLSAVFFFPFGCYRLGNLQGVFS